MNLIELPDVQKRLIEDVVGHPQEAPTRPEIEHLNPSLSRDTISEHLESLRENGVVEEVGLDADGSEYDCYRLSAAASDEIESGELYPDEEWKRQYERADKPDDIRELAELPRPEP